MHILLLPLLFLYSFSELIWMGFILLFPFWLTRRITKHRLYQFLSCVAGCVLFFFHMAGFKAWGCEYRFVDLTSPLDHPVELAAIEPPGVVQTMGSEAYPLYGVRITRSFRRVIPDAASITEETWAIWDASHRLEMNVFRVHDKEPILMEAQKQSNGTYKVMFQQRRRSYCASGSSPGLFPYTHPNYRAKDLGVELVLAGWATPQEDLLQTEPAYAKELQQAHEYRLSRLKHTTGNATPACPKPAGR